MRNDGYSFVKRFMRPTNRSVCVVESGSQTSSIISKIKQEAISSELPRLMKSTYC